jgi:hypothetical protein
MWRCLTYCPPLLSYASMRFRKDLLTLISIADVTDLQATRAARDAFFKHSSESKIMSVFSSFTFCTVCQKMTMIVDPNCKKFRKVSCENVMLVASRIWSGSLILANQPVYFTKMVEAPGSLSL